MENSALNSNAGIKPWLQVAVGVGLIISATVAVSNQFPTSNSAACDLAAGNANRLNCLEPAQEPTWYPYGGGGGRAMLAYTIRI